MQFNDVYSDSIKNNYNGIIAQSLIKCFPKELKEFEDDIIWFLNKLVKEEGIIDSFQYEEELNKFIESELTRMFIMDLDQFKSYYYDIWLNYYYGYTVNAGFSYDDNDAEDEFDSIDSFPNFTFLNSILEHLEYLEVGYRDNVILLYDTTI